jgi:teichuronic acid biosynthesis glycosyltransferase TuaC
VRVLLATSEWPEAHRPSSGVWVADEVEHLRRLGVEIDVVAFRGARRPQNYLRLRREVKTRLRTNHYDLVHAHFGHTAFTVLPLRVPLVVTFHGSDLLGIVGRRGRYTPAGWVIRQISRSVARGAAKVIVVASNLVPRLPKGTDYVINPMGVDLSRFAPQDKAASRARLGLQPDRRYVLFSGNPGVPRKRYELAVEAVAALPGDLDAELITIEGQPHDAVPTYMNAADALLVTAKHETGPVTVKEALACDLPIVSVDVGDVRRWIGSLQGSELCADDRPTTIAAALERVLTSAAPFDGRSVAEAELDEALLASRVKAVYDEVVREVATR